MTAPDIVNGVFEALGGFTGYINCRRLIRDKCVKGVVWQLHLFYTAWGLWNLYYYPNLRQWASFFGGILIVLFNAVWLCLAVYYLRRNDGDSS